MNSQLTVALLVGGASPERQVSKSSSASIYKALLSLGHRVILIDPAYGKNQPSSPEDFFGEKDLFPVDYKNYIQAIESGNIQEADTVFIGLHGKWGEDGTVQGMLELSGKPYTGSGILASALAMDKDMSVSLFQRNGVQTPEGFLIKKTDAEDKHISEVILEKTGLPCVIKPNDQGSTVGLSIVHTVDEILPAFNECFRYSDGARVEKYITGRELAVGIIDDIVLPVLEIKPKHEIYDYECKYTSGMSEYIVPADIPEDIAHTIQNQAMLAFNALGCKGYGRADFRLSPDNQSYCMEMNTLPGMTSTSLVPKMAKAIGISFEQLIERIVSISLR